VYCAVCNRELTQAEPMNKVGPDILCTTCNNKRFGLRQTKTGDSVLDEIGLNIPGLVVLRGKQEREIGRLMQDASAKEEHRRVERKRQMQSGELNCEVPVAKILYKVGILQRELYIEMKKYQRQSGTTFFDTIARFNLIDPNRLAALMSENTGIPFLQVDDLPVDQSAKNLLSRDTIQMYLIIPMSKQTETLNLAVVNPYDKEAIDDAEKITGLEISPVICTYNAFLAAYQRNYAQ